MAETPSNMIPLGTKAPDFSLFDVISDREISLQAIRSNVATVILFICNHCPYVKLIQSKIVEIANQFQPQGVQFIAINSNDTEKYPDDAPEKMRVVAAQYHYPFPYLFDRTQAVAKAYQAACTPDIYVFDHDLKCVYRGRFDEATPGNGKTVDGADLKMALDCLLAHKPIPSNQMPSVGCNIKWKK